MVDTPDLISDLVEHVIAATVPSLKNQQKQ